MEPSSDEKTSSDGDLELDTETSIGKLPEAVFEYILSHLHGYADLYHCKLVSRRWHEAVLATIAKNRRDFKRALRNDRLEWTEFQSHEPPNISPRYSHNACLHGWSMYVFGGCTAASTTFNDLWSFDLGTMDWVRPSITGKYPPPKACASFVKFHDKLFLYGGWTHSPTMSMHPDPNAIKLFNDLHQYDPETGRWSAIQPKNEGPKLAAHSALIHAGQMLIFGGLTQDADLLITRKSNVLWLLNMDSFEWRQQRVSNSGPNPRYGCSMLSLSETQVSNTTISYFLLVGGCGGANMMFNDVWLLTSTTGVAEWTWTEINILPNDPVTLPIIGFNPVINVDGLLVMVSKGNNNTRGVESLKDGPVLRRPAARNEIQPSLMAMSRLQAQPSTSQRKNQFLDYPKIKNLKPSIRPNARLDREKQLENLNKMAEKLKRIRSVWKTSRVKITPRTCENAMKVYVFDTSEVIVNNRVTLCESVGFSTGPEEIMLYSLVSFSSELIIFGGIHSLKYNGSDTVRNSVLVASPMKTII